MLEKIKNVWRDWKIAIVAAALFAVYFLGIKRGKSDEKASQNKSVLANISRAGVARRRLRDSGVLHRLRKKYTRK
ncbi:MAG: hypothetical protein LBL75_01670 [Rickettsiales bacterium]|jgi:hypothetical protein|nr:hypothetical protein [Rickettsiales bacterium]